MYYELWETTNDWHEGPIDKVVNWTSSWMPPCMRPVQGEWRKHVWAGFKSKGIDATNAAYHDKFWGDPDQFKGPIAGDDLKITLSGYLIFVTSGQFEKADRDLFVNTTKAAGKLPVSFDEPASYKGITGGKHVYFSHDVSYHLRFGVKTTIEYHWLEKSHSYTTNVWK